MLPVLLKTANTAKQKITSIPPDKRSKIIYVVLIIAFALIFGKRLAGAIRNMFQKDINKLEVNTSNLTYQRGDYYSMCSTLEASMNGWGTQVSPIIDVFKKLKSIDDWNFLQKSFGEREKEGGTIVPNITGDLKMWLSDELDISDMEEIRDILLENGISY